MFLTVVDLEKAFDSIKKKETRKILEIDKKLIKIIKTYTERQRMLYR